MSFVQNPTSGKWSIVKDPDAVLDYVFDWGQWLTAVGDLILTASPVVTSGVSPPSNVAVDSYQIVGNTVVVWVSGGAAGETVPLRCRITTDNVPPRTDDRTVYLKIKQR